MYGQCGVDPFASQPEIRWYLEPDFVLATARHRAGGLSLVRAEGRCVVPHGLDPEFGFAVISLCAADSVTVLSFTFDPKLPAIASRRHVCGDTVLAADSLKTRDLALALALALPRSRLIASSKFINIPIEFIVLIARLIWRAENRRTVLLLAPTLAYLVNDGLLSAQSLVDNQRAASWFIPKALLSVAIVAALVVFREVAPL